MGKKPNVLKKTKTKQYQWPVIDNTQCLVNYSKKMEGMSLMWDICFLHHFKNVKKYKVCWKTAHMKYLK